MKVSGKPQDMRSFAKDLRKFEDEIKQATNQLRRSFSRVDWDDPQRQRFEQSLNDMLKASQRSVSSAPELAKTLDRKAGELERYLGR